MLGLLKKRNTVDERGLILQEPFSGKEIMSIKPLESTKKLGLGKELSILQSSYILN
jgi:hypothetical protein